MLKRSAVLFALLLGAGCATGGTTASPAASKESRTIVPSQPQFVAADFVGKEAPEIDALLGAPDLTRIEGDGEFRRYDLATCALMIILYPDDQGTRRAARLDAGALETGAEKPDLDQCLARGRAS